MTTKRKPWMFAIIYVVLSLAIEASLIIFGGLRVRADNAKITPIILTIPPILAAILRGYRRLKEFFTLTVLTVIFTLVITLTFIKITGVSTGLFEPIISRSIAGFLAALITNKVTGVEEG